MTQHSTLNHKETWTNMSSSSKTFLIFIVSQVKNSASLVRCPESLYCFYPHWCHLKFWFHRTHNTSLSQTTSGFQQTRCLFPTNTIQLQTCFQKKKKISVRINRFQRVLDLQSSMPKSCAAREKQEGILFISGVIQTSKLWFLPSSLLHGLTLYLSTFITRALLLFKKYLPRMVALSKAKVTAKDRVKQETCARI